MFVSKIDYNGIATVVCDERVAEKIICQFGDAYEHTPFQFFSEYIVPYITPDNQCENRPLAEQSFSGSDHMRRKIKIFTEREPAEDGVIFNIVGIKRQE